MSRLSSASSRLLKEVGGTACETGSAGAAAGVPPALGGLLGLQPEGRAASAHRSLAELTDPFSDPSTGCTSVAVYLQVSLSTFA